MKTDQKKAATATPADGAGAGDDLLSFAEAARTLPGKPSPSTIWRWSRRGVVARDGQRVRLRCVRLGGRMFTTRAAILAFGEALAEADARHFDADDSDAPAPAETPERNPADRKAAMTDAGARLAAAGV